MNPRSDQKKWTFKLIIINKETDVPRLENERIFKIQFPDPAEKRTEHRLAVVR